MLTLRGRRLVRWIVGAVAGVLAGLWIAVLGLSRAPLLRQQLVQTLNERLDADVELGAFEVKTFPLLRIHGDRLKLRLKGQTSSSPLIEVRHFEVAGGLWGMLRRNRRFSNVQLDGLTITIPPRTPDDRRAGGRAAGTLTGIVLIEHLQAQDAQLIIVPKNPEKEPKVFVIHTLYLDSVGFDRPIPFTATLTNAVPAGEIATQGSFGPWMTHDPGATPLRGRYSLDRADLATIRGIGGSLASTGDFSGTLAKIDVRGRTSTPDFTLDVGGSPVPLDTTFHAVVDGTDGDTFLTQVDAKLAQTAIGAVGAIVSQPNREGRTVKLEVTIEDGRIEDVLRLAVSAPRPVMLGRIGLQAAVLVPAGKAPVADRMRLAGRFALLRTRFTDPGVQQQLATLSRRAQGKTSDAPIGPIVSSMAGRFEWRDAVLRFQDLRFDLPGADVALAGVYAVRSQQVNLAGTLAMDAPISKAAGGGVKGLLLKPLDPLFRKRGKGAVLPITITGPRKGPKFALNWRKVLK